MKNTERCELKYSLKNYQTSKYDKIVTERKDNELFKEKNIY